VAKLFEKQRTNFYYNWLSFIGDFWKVFWCVFYGAQCTLFWSVFCWKASGFLWKR